MLGQWQNPSTEPCSWAHPEESTCVTHQSSPSLCVAAPWATAAMATAISTLRFYDGFRTRLLPNCLRFSFPLQSYVFLQSQFGRRGSFSQQWGSSGQPHPLLGARGDMEAKVGTSPQHQWNACVLVGRCLSYSAVKIILWIWHFMRNRISSFSTFPTVLKDLSVHPPALSPSSGYY